MLIQIVQSPTIFLNVGQNINSTDHASSFLLGFLSVHFGISARAKTINENNECVTTQMLFSKAYMLLVKEPRGSTNRSSSLMPAPSKKEGDLARDM